MKTTLRVPGKGPVEVEENWIDRTIRYFDPVKGQRRFGSRVQMAVSGAYHGASKTRRAMSQFMPSAGSANADILGELPDLRARSRDLVRNDAIAGGAINTACTNVVGTGVIPHPTIDREVLGLSDEAADLWEADAEREWKLWSESTDCDITRAQTFAGLQELAFRSTLENGDILALLPMPELGPHATIPYRLRVQLIEADRLSNKDRAPDTGRLAGGVVLDEYGAPTAYHVLRNHPGDLRRQGRDLKWDVITAYGEQSGRRNVLHCFKRIRIGQTRGVPYLAPVIEPLKQLGRYTEAEIMAAVVSGLFTMVIKTETGEGLDLGATAGETGAKPGDDDLKLGNGAVLELGADEDVSFADPSRPNTSFDPFVMSILRQVGVQLELPFEILIKHFTASYSAARAALLEAWKFFSARRRWLVVSFAQPIYEELLAEAVATGRLAAPGFFEDPLIRKAYCGATWIGPSKGQINEKVEMDALGRKVELGALTYQQMTAEATGGDWEKNQHQLKRERALIAETTPTPEAETDGDDNQDGRANQIKEPVQPSITVNVPAPVVNVQNDVSIPEQEAPVVNMQNDYVIEAAPTPDVTVNPPTVNVEAPVVTVEAPVVNVDLPENDREVTHERDADGKITKSTIKDRKPGSGRK